MNAVSAAALNGGPRASLSSRSDVEEPRQRSASRPAGMGSVIRVAMSP